MRLTVSCYIPAGKRHEPHVESNNMSVVEATLYKAYRVVWLYKFGKCEASLGRCLYSQKFRNKLYVKVNFLLLVYGLDAMAWESGNFC